MFQVRIYFRLIPDDDVDMAETLVSLLAALPNVIRLSVEESRVEESFDWNDVFK